MKKTKSLGLLLIIIALFFVCTGMRGAKESVSESEELVITGTIEQHGKTFLLKEDSGLEFQIQGKDLSEMVGKKVKATGELIEEGDEVTLKVNKVEEASKVKMKDKLDYEEFDE